MSDPSEIPDARHHGAAVDLFVRWTATVAEENPIVTNIERDADVDRWYVRVRGEEKLVTTVWFTVRERTMHFESYFLPEPEGNAAQFYEYLLRANNRLYAMRFSIGLEDATYLTGIMGLDALLSGGEAELDRILGSVYAASEACFRTAGRIGFPGRFT